MYIDMPLITNNGVHITFTCSPLSSFKKSTWNYNFHFNRGINWLTLLTPRSDKNSSLFVLNQVNIFITSTLRSKMFKHFT